MFEKNDKKRKYDKKLPAAILENDDFLIEKLEKEWEQIQKEAKKEEIVRKTKEAGLFMAKTILALAAIAGVLMVAAVAPNIFTVFGRTSGRKRDFFDQKNFNVGLQYLKDKKQVTVESGKNGRLKIDLTERGKTVILKSVFDRLKIENKGTWDGFWRIVAFDIPNNRKMSRDGFRHKLKSMGFYPLQKSLFVIPFECEKEIDFLTEIYNVGECTHFIKTQNISNAETIRKHFSLV